MHEADTRMIGLFLIEGFALMSYASAVEPFRAANVLAGRELYRWRHISIDGAPVCASNGASIAADQQVGEALDCDTLFVFAGGDPAHFDDTSTFAWLRRLAATGVKLAGISGGPYLLARAGVLDGYAATIHWDHQLAFVEQFPHIALDPGLYVIDRRRMTCAGGTAGLDLAIELIEREHGHALATRVSDWFIRTEHRAPDSAQRLGLRERRGIRDDRLLKVLAHMEASVEEPASRPALARLAGVSIRQLERLFRARLGQSVNEAYLTIRLEQARALLRKTSMAVTDIGLACGFRNSSHFAQAYRRTHGCAPSAERGGVAP